MPTRNRTRGAAVETSEILTELGFDVHDIRGPITAEGEELDPEAADQTQSEGAEPEYYQYYIIAGLEKSSFYLKLQSDRSFGTIIYPMDIISALSGQLEEKEVGAILGEPIDWDSIDENQRYALYSEAIENIIQNTDQDVYYRAVFNLSAYASTSLVQYTTETTEDGFPKEFQCGREFFPFTENLTLQYVNDRVISVLIAGERGRRYVNYSFKIHKEGKEPPEYEIRTVI